MNREERRAIIARLIKTMRNKGSWAGNTHVQKSVYFLQELMDIRTGYRFVMYKHGPFSFDLRDELTNMEADLLLDVELRNPYGPSFTMGYHDISDKKEASAYDYALTFVSDALADKDIRSLERIATALFTQTHNSEKNESELAELIIKMKPHITMPQAMDAIREVSKLRQGSELLRKGYEISCGKGS